MIIANFSLRERVVFLASLCLLAIGAFGGIVELLELGTVSVPVFGGTYREAIIGSPRAINPVLATTDADRDLTALVYSGLVRIDATGTPIADLAESWTISPDGKTYSFVLKPKLRFHDGTSLTTDDIAFTVSKIQDPALKSPLRVAFEGVTTHITDVRTIEFTLEKPYAGFINQLTVGILPSHIWKDIPDDLWGTDTHATDAIGSGPYRITAISRTKAGLPQTITLGAFRRFALGKPHIKTVIIDSYTSRMDARDTYDSGSVDALAAADSTDADALADGNSQTVTSPLPRVFGLFMNPAKNKLFADASVVRAINLAIDRQAIIDAVFAGYAHPISGPLPHMTDTTPGDIAEKRALAAKTLDAAGWKLNPETNIREKKTTTGKTTSSEILSFSIATAGTPELEKTADLIADQLAQLGIQVEVKAFEIGALNASVIRNRDFEALLFGEIIRHDTDLYAFWHSSQKSDPGLNITGYASTRVDQLLESALHESDAVKRSGLYEQIRAELAKNASVAFLYAPDFIYLADRGIHHMILPPIAVTSDRFGLIYQWYIEENRVWRIFSPDQET